MRKNKDYQLTNHFEQLLKKAENITAKYNKPLNLKKLPVAKRVFPKEQVSENIKEEVLTGWSEKQSNNGSSIINNSGDSAIHALETKRHSKP